MREKLPSDPARHITTQSRNYLVKCPPRFESSLSLRQTNPPVTPSRMTQNESSNLPSSPCGGKRSVTEIARAHGSTPPGEVLELETTVPIARDCHFSKATRPSQRAERNTSALTCSTFGRLKGAEKAWQLRGRGDLFPTPWLVSSPPPATMPCASSPSKKYLLPIPTSRAGWSRVGRMVTSADSH